MSAQEIGWEHNPGSDEAVERGCRCPILDNGHGKGCGGLGREWWINGDCPLHGVVPADLVPVAFR